MYINYKIPYFVDIPCILKSLRSVQFSILESKITPEVLRIDQYCENSLGMLTTKSFFNVRFGVTALPSIYSIGD